MSHEEKLSSLTEDVTRKLSELRSLGDTYESLCVLQRKKAEEFSPQHIKV